MLLLVGVLHLHSPPPPPTLSPPPALGLGGCTRRAPQAHKASQSHFQATLSGEAESGPQMWQLAQPPWRSRSEETMSNLPPTVIFEIER